MAQVCPLLELHGFTGIAAHGCLRFVGLHALHGEGVERLDDEMALVLADHLVVVVPPVPQDFFLGHHVLGSEGLEIAGDEFVLLVLLEGFHIRLAFVGVERLALADGLEAESLGHELGLREFYRASRAVGDGLAAACRHAFVGKADGLHYVGGRRGQGLFRGAPVVALARELERVADFFEHGHGHAEDFHAAGKDLPAPRLVALEVLQDGQFHAEGAGNGHARH